MNNEDVEHLSADDLFAEEVRRARMQPVAEKVFLGIELFDYACEVTQSGIRMQHPDADEDRVLDILRERLALARRLEDST